MSIIYIIIYIIIYLHHYLHGILQQNLIFSMIFTIIHIIIYLHHYLHQILQQNLNVKFTWFFTLIFYCNSCCLFTSIYTSKFTYNPKLIFRKMGWLLFQKRWVLYWNNNVACKWIQKGFIFTCYIYYLISITLTAACSPVYVAVPKQSTEYQYCKHTEVSLSVQLIK